MMMKQRIIKHRFIKQRLINIFQLGIKELYSLRYDPVMLFLIIYSFTFSVYMIAKGNVTGVVNAAVAIVDEDRSQLSQRINDALLPPQFLPPEQIGLDEIDTAMDAGRYTFVIDIPPDFQADIMAGRQPVIQLNVDATAMGMAGTGAGYIHRIIAHEVTVFLKGAEPKEPVSIVTRARFNPNLDASWFDTVIEVANNITLLAIMLTGAALIREREHGTIEHLLVMPLTPAEIMIAKVWANGLAILVAASFSLYVVVQGLLAIPIIGSIPLFLGGTVLYLFSVTALGIFLATLARSMPQFGLLALLVFIVMIMLSGTHSPLESMPVLLRSIMQLVPSTHYINFVKAVLFRGAGLDVVWLDIVAITIIGSVLFIAALLRFRKTVTLTQV
jgi:ABC-2 type transport system permease protein